MKVLTWSATVVACAALAACGGGGGDESQDDGSDAASASFTTATYEAGAKVAMQGLMASNRSLSLITEPRGGGTVEVESSRGREQRTAASSASPAPTGIEFLPCESGRLLYAFFDPAGASWVGQTLTLTSEGCTLLGEAYSGQLQGEVTAVSEHDGYTTSDTRVDFENFGTASGQLQGTMTGSITEKDSTQGIDLTYQANFEGVVLKATGEAPQPLRHQIVLSYNDEDRNAAAESFSGSADAGNGLVQIKQVAPFRFNVSSGLPTGKLVLVDKAGGEVRITPANGRFRYDFYAPGNTTSRPDASTEAGPTYLVR